MGSRSKQMFVRTNDQRPRMSRQEFIDLYNANPCNSIPAPVLHELYRRTSTTRKLNAAASKWLAERAAE